MATRLWLVIGRAVSRHEDRAATVWRLGEHESEANALAEARMVADAASADVEITGLQAHDISEQALAFARSTLEGRRD